MLIRGVIQHEVHDDAYAVFLGLCQQTIEILQSAVHAIDRLIVGDVVAEIDLR